MKFIPLIFGMTDVKMLKTGKMNTTIPLLGGAGVGLL